MPFAIAEHCKRLPNGMHQGGDRGQLSCATIARRHVNVNGVDTLHAFTCDLRQRSRSGGYRRPAWTNNGGGLSLSLSERTNLSDKAAIVGEIDVMNAPFDTDFCKRCRQCLIG